MSAFIKGEGDRDWRGNLVNGPRPNCFVTLTPSSDEKVGHAYSVDSESTVLGMVERTSRLSATETAKWDALGVPPLEDREYPYIGEGIKVTPRGVYHVSKGTYKHCGVVRPNASG